MVANPFYSKYFRKESAVGGETYRRGRQYRVRFLPGSSRRRIRSRRVASGRRPDTPEPVALGILSPESDVARPSQPVRQLPRHHARRHRRRTRNCARKTGRRISLSSSRSRTIFSITTSLWCSKESCLNAPKAHGELRRAQTVLWETLNDGRAIENDFYSPMNVNLCDDITPASIRQQGSISARTM